MERKQNLKLGREALKSLKQHDNFLSEIKMVVQKDERLLKEDIDQKLNLALIVNKAAVELNEKKEEIMMLRGKVSEIDQMGREVDLLREKGEEEAMKGQAMEKEILDLEDKVRKLMEDNEELQKDKGQLEVQCNGYKDELQELIPSNKVTLEELKLTKEDCEGRLDTMQEQLGFARDHETKSKEKLSEVSHEFDALQSEFDAKMLKVEYLESKLEEKYHMEALFIQLKDDYEELRREKMVLVNQYEQTLNKKNNELKTILEEKDDLVRENLKFEKREELDNINSEELRSSLHDAKGQLCMASEQHNRMEQLVEQKQERIDYFSAEISSMNSKILEFGSLMEKLITENQRMKVSMEEAERKEMYFRRQMKEFSRIRRDMKDKKYTELDRLASTLETFSGT